eukprot:CAMPEP_0202732746 /NCGR_PEP_ID=MMETSP1385-20130828/187818_1 /ASSEMBLY_ACC=CAM_ASM_000861 /TAXON_ID=933848 /ORGANISM="Elphidium margaritaceum" /LENGTH=125 /DNA_ID=CAMNT_0049399069 /DNA_START=604 /DNA_END=978 /DNA_ORIENTATION=+
MSRIFGDSHRDVLSKLTAELADGPSTAYVSRTKAPVELGETVSEADGAGTETAADNDGADDGQDLHVDAETGRLPIGSSSPPLYSNASVDNSGNNADFARTLTDVEMVEQGQTIIVHDSDDESAK